MYHVCVDFFVLSYVNDYIEDTVTFTALAKTYSTEYLCNTMVAGLSTTLSSEIFGYNVLWIKLTLSLLKGSAPCLMRSSTILSIRLKYSSFVNCFS